MESDNECLCQCLFSLGNQSGHPDCRCGPHKGDIPRETNVVQMGRSELDSLKGGCCTPKLGHAVVCSTPRDGAVLCGGCRPVSYPGARYTLQHRGYISSPVRGHATFSLLPQYPDRLL